MEEEQTSDRGKCIAYKTPKRPSYEDMSRHISDLLGDSGACYNQCEVHIPSPFQPTLADDFVPQEDVEIHDVLNSSEFEGVGREEPGRDETDLKFTGPSQDQGSEVASSKSVVAFDGTTSRVLPITTGKETRMVPTSSLLVGSSQPMEIPPPNPGSSFRYGPSHPQPMTSPRPWTYGRKFPLQSLKDGLLGCPLEAFQALIPENYLQGGAGQTTSDHFADILVHHQIMI